MCIYTYVCALQAHATFRIKGKSIPRLQALINQLHATNSPALSQSYLRQNFLYDQQFYHSAYGQKGSVPWIERKTAMSYIVMNFYSPASILISDKLKQGILTIKDNPKTGIKKHPEKQRWSSTGHTEQMTGCLSLVLQTFHGIYVGSRGWWIRCLVHLWADSRYQRAMGVQNCPRPRAVCTLLWKQRHWLLSLQIGQQHESVSYNIKYQPHPRIKLTLTGFNKRFVRRF